MQGLSYCIKIVSITEKRFSLIDTIFYVMRQTRLGFAKNNLIQIYGYSVQNYWMSDGNWYN